MKKIVSMILVVLLVGLFPTAVFAEDTKTTLTPQQQAARQTFLQDHHDEMVKLIDLRAQTNTARQENQKLENQIKEKLKSLYGTLNKDQVAQIKTMAKQNKDLETQARALNEKRKPLVDQYKAAVKNKDASAAANLKEQISGLTKQINDLKDKIAASRKTIEPLMGQIKIVRDNIKAVHDKAKSLQGQNKQLVQKINGEEKAKQELWAACRSQIQAKDYAAAGTTLSQILTAKANILTDIKARTEILKQILAAIA